MSTPLEDYALIGDCETAALVSRAGSIDWLCWPRFDSGACFAALLGTPEHGRWLIEAADPDARVSRRYRDSTLILETRIETAGGAVTVIDFMPPRGRNSDIVRLVRGDRGRVQMRTELVLRFDYGRTVPWVTSARRRHAPRDRRSGHGDPPHAGSAARAGPDDDRRVRGGGGRDGAVRPDARIFASRRRPTRSIRSPRWNTPNGSGADWAAGSRSHGEWSDAVTRSLITLKALTYAPTGGIVAAPTTSLPEQLGGSQKLGLSLLLAARCDADAAGADERRLLRRGAGLARLAAARRGGRPVAAADHVRPRRRAAPDRIRGAVAARLRGLAAGADRQCRARPAAARRLRRSDGRAAPGASRRPRLARRRLGVPARDARAPRDDLAAAGRGHLGGARRTAGTSPTRR